MKGAKVKGMRNSGDKNGKATDARMQKEGWNIRRAEVTKLRGNLQRVGHKTNNHGIMYVENHQDSLITSRNVQEGEKRAEETQRKHSWLQVVLFEAISGKTSFTIFTILTSGRRCLISYNVLAASPNSPHDSHNFNVLKAGPNTGFEVVGQ